MEWECWFTGRRSKQAALLGGPIHRCFYASVQRTKRREGNSSVPHFNRFINDLETGISSGVEKFTDDTKLFWVVKTTRDCEELQKDLSRLGEWAVKWQM